MTIIKQGKRWVHDDITKGSVIQGNVEISAATSLDYYNTVVDGYFNCANCAIRSLDGSPTKVRGDFNCGYNPIQSLDGCPRDVGGSFWITCTGITSLKDIHKKIDRIGKYLQVDDRYFHNILGLLKIRDLQAVMVQNSRDNANDQVYRMWNIINDHLYEQPNPMKRDIQIAQEQLIEAGFAEYAEL